MALKEWLRQHGLDRYAAQFEEHEVGVDILATLTDDDLREIGLPLGARKRFMNALRDASDAAKPELGERRQITVLFGDLVDYTGLATRMDPEDLEALIERVVSLCREEVSRWGGHVANYLGDGIMVYFGWPQAYEDAPQRAAHASLRMLEAVAGLRGPDGRALSMRVGMATGLVLIGRRLEAGMGEVETVFGEPPNLAARLEAKAAPGQVLLDASTARLLPEGHFAKSDLGADTFKGFSEPMGVWRLDASQTTARAPTGANAPGHTIALQGRDGAVAQLQHWWEEAQNQNCLRMVRISGEAGIGKSHLVGHFLRSCQLGGAASFELQCWPYNENATLYPVVSCLNTRAGVQPGDDVARRRHAFERIATQAGLDPQHFLHGMGDLLELGEVPERQGAEARRAAWFATITAALRAISERAPVLLVLEDLHWTDPLTEELLDHIAGHCTACRIMIVATTRQMFEPNWVDHPHARLLDLSRVESDAAEMIIDGLAGASGLTAVTRQRIIDASDGVPLFVHELTRELLERKTAQGDGEHMTIPATLQGVLSSRLDSAEDAKPLAQVASCIGRKFARDLLVKVAGQTEYEVQRRLDRLMTLALVEPLDEGEPTYIFRHALIQEAAYQSQPRRSRRKVHGRIADLMAAQPAADALQVANHMTVAERFSPAVDWWKRAGDRAARRSALREAAEHYRRGLALFDRMSESEANRVKRLGILLALGPVLSALDGYGADSVGTLFHEAADLSEGFGSVPDRFAVHRGLWMYHQMSAQYQRAETSGQALLDLAEDAGLQEHEAARLEAHRALGATAFMLGKLTTARHHLETALRGYQAQDAGKHVALYGDDPGLGCMAYLGATHWYLGDPERAATTCEDMLAQARQVDHPFSMARSLTFSAFTYHQMRDLDRLLPIAEDAVAHADKFEFPFHSGVGRILLGWGLCQDGRCDQGWPVIEQGYAEYASSGSHMLQPLYLSLMATIAGARGDADAAWQFSKRAMARIDVSQEALVLPEVLRVHAKLLLERDGTDAALPVFRRAIEIAQSQTSRFCALRALTLAVPHAPDLVVTMQTELAHFPPTMQTSDLKAARTAVERAEKGVT
ncbi:AAA family ATPase [Primorskyibacter aestuariivivens]|uniref:adenylate/guanylate cyclase domain-containing protein n=1 Tax=Primorskyibacter aestuariivivens TaxID=1888912 RepID=UPI0023009A66|nr:adenylate/guanylate cyclase domain-containing protein [Primorskyibacter aestuariivivens]MDA7429283.1 AAA family ATPase [Primorskyibacter aestuariivivens]